MEKVDLSSKKLGLGKALGFIEQSHSMDCNTLASA